MTVQELLRNPEHWLNQTVSLEGIFIMQRGMTYVVDSEDDTEALGKAICISHFNLKQLLFSKLSPWAGGRRLYSDSIEVEGHLSPGDSPPFLYSLTKIHRMTISRRNEVFQIVS